VVGRCRGRNLHFPTAVEEAIALADLVFISVNTPTKTKGLGAGQASDLKWVEALARTLAKAARGHTIVVEKSTLPVRTAELIQKILASVEGTAIADLEKPDRLPLQPSHRGDRGPGADLRPVGGAGEDPAQQPLEQRAAASPRLV
jgi:UDPglucose 6-dehydrogenase